MDIKTKFNNGDVVWLATVYDGSISDTACEECGGQGSLEIKGKIYRLPCPNRCRNGRVCVYGPKPSAKTLTLGRVQVTITDSPGQSDASIFSNFGPQHGREEMYMAIETGVGSGSCYYAEDLFATEEEALERAKWKVVEATQRRAEEEERRQKEREQARAQLVVEETEDVG